MTFLDKLERRLGWLAVPGLIRIIIALTALVYVLAIFQPGFVSVLTLDPARIRHGEFWRLVTYLFIPQSLGQPGSLLSPLWLLMALWFLLFIGDGLERAWGAFRLTLYFLVGMIATTISAFVFGAQFSNSLLATSLFFAFANFYPDETIYLLFVLPVKVKWLAWIMGALLLVQLVGGPLAFQMALVTNLANYLIFFGPQHLRVARQSREVSMRRQRFEKSASPTETALHRCAVCGATEESDPDLEFRVARDGEEYCLAHLPNAVSEVGA